MNSTTAVMSVAAAVSPATGRDALIEAHTAAEDFHAGMSQALLAEAELADQGLFDEDRKYWTRQYQQELGKAVAALQKMPKSWAAILEIALPAVPAAAPAAAE